VDLDTSEPVANEPAGEAPPAEMPIVPVDSIAGRALVAVIAIMTFLASLTQRLLRLSIELNKSGTSVVIATHDIALMDQYDARRLVLHEGRMHVYE